MLIQKMLAIMLVQSKDILLFYGFSFWDVCATDHYRPHTVKIYSFHSIHVHLFHTTHIHPAVLHLTLHSNKYDLMT